MADIEYQNQVGETQAAAMEYVGFWARVAAPLLGLSLVIYSVPFAMLTMIKILHALGLTHVNYYNSEQILNDMNYMLIGNERDGLALLMFYIAYLLYLSLMESSERQASLGKLMIGAKVIGKNGGRISVQRALLRNFLKPLSAFSILGVLMIGFTRRKRALHDIFCNTFVIRTDNN